MNVESKYGVCEYSFENEYVHVFNLFVFKKYRGNGKATELLETVIEKIRETGYNGEIQIVADPKEKGINKQKLKLFYIKLGLRVFDYYG